MVSFQDLLAAEPDLFAQAGKRWGAFGAALAERHAELRRQIGAAGGQWEGEARDTAVAHLDTVTDRIRRNSRLVEQIPPVYFGHARTVASAQQLLRNAVAAAEGTPISVGADGTVRILPRSVSDMGMLADPAQQALLVMRAKVIAEAITGALAVATESDDAAASRLQELVPDNGRLKVPSKPPMPAIPPPGTSPQQVHDWWEGLSPQEQLELIQNNPKGIGNLDGIPAGARDQANRIVLASHPDYRDRVAELERLGEERSEEQTAELERLKGIEAIRDRLETTEPQQAYLLGFDPSGNGKAIVAVGNPDTADNVVTYVPGTGAGLRSVRTDMARADLIADEATKLDPGSSTSAIMWIGYEAPQDLGEAVDPKFAERAGPTLDSFQHGLRATHEGAPSHNTVLGHSYGSTVVGHTAADHGLAADDVIFLGSPGVGVDHASELGLDRDHVWSSHAKNDPIQHALDPGDVARSMITPDPEFDLIHGHNPSADDFGGRTFTSDPGSPMEWQVQAGPWYRPWDVDVMFSTDAHSEYWEQRSSSLKNMTAIIIDQDDLVK